MSVETVKLGLPVSLQSFGLFTRLPFELQNVIWQAAITTPSISFFRLNANLVFVDQNEEGFTSRVGNLNDDEQLDETLVITYANLRPSSLSPIADISQGLERSEQRLCISNVSIAARASIQRLEGKTGSLQHRMGTARNFTVYYKSDLFFLQYIHPAFYQSECNLSVKFVIDNIDCWSSIRRVGLRFERDWNVNAGSGICPWCRRTHRGQPVRPFHVYQFLARHFPNLEEVWFLDYMMLPKATGESLQKRKEDIYRDCYRSFRAKDRTFYASSTKHWDLKPDVQAVVGWIEQHYVQYSKNSRFCQHRHPKNVRFGVLGCIWDNSLSLSNETLHQSSAVQERRARPTKKRHAVGQPATRHARRTQLEADLPDSKVSEEPSTTGEAELDSVSASSQGRSSTLTSHSNPSGSFVELLMAVGLPRDDKRETIGL